MEHWCRRLRDVVSCAAKQALEVAKGSCDLRESFSNVCPLARMGVKLLDSSEYVAVPTDKDGGFALVEKDFYDGCVHDVLDPMKYFGVPKLSVPTANIFRTYQGLVGRLGKVLKDRKCLAC